MWTRFRCLAKYNSQYYAEAVDILELLDLTCDLLHPRSAVLVGIADYKMLHHYSRVAVCTVLPAFQMHKHFADENQTAEFLVVVVRLELLHVQI